MLSQTLRVERGSLGTEPKRSTAGDNSRTARVLPLNAPRETSQAPTIQQLLVTLSPDEPHHEVAMRAQFLASEASVGRAVVVTPPLAPYQRVLQHIALLAPKRGGPELSTSARVLWASGLAKRTRLQTAERAADALRLTNDSELVLVGRRRTFPKMVAPLNANARRLLRRTRTPLLVVGSRPRGPYRRVLLATDLKTDITPALDWARRVAPRASITFLHVYRGVFEGKLQWAGVPNERITSHRLDAQQEAGLGMTALVEQHGPDTISRALLAHGFAIFDVVRKARELDADLIVTVRGNHSWWIDALGASVSFEIAGRSDRDVLVVHEAASTMNSSLHGE